VHHRASRKPVFWLLIVLSVGGIAGCASHDPEDEDSGYVEYDPLEPLNRKIHSFNMTMDRTIMRPVARGYEKVVPSPFRRSITNFFSNLTAPRSALNNFLQGKPGRGFNELGRFLFNSTLGVAGLFDIASAAGMERYDETFGETLGVWGVPEGPYVVIPFWGPNMMSDAFALPVDYYSDVWTYYDNSSVRDKVWGIRLIDLRYRLLSVDAFLEDSPDPYVAVREAFRQNRTFRVYDGNPPQEEEDFYDDEMFDEFFEDDLFDEEAENVLEEAESDE
jgi:phospholipid-binding lipoprotein MlaA